ncbi:MAG TPA: hypothetical protein VN765_12645 [Candidatus Acidoferrum sp.]|nr:hypothetical protein [Candidatus Acidoferrum sp.]
MPWWYARPFYRLLFRGFFLTIVALAAAIWWILSMPDMSGIRDYHYDSGQFIRERCHFFLVPPQWMSGGATATGLDSDPVGRWEVAEMKARAIVVFTLWAVIVSYFIWRCSKQNSALRPVSEPLKISH